jgi:hypothetical protein
MDSSEFTSRDTDYISFTSQPPYGVALVRRKFDGRVVVGAAFQHERSLRTIMESLKAELRRAHIDLNKVIGVFNDDETATALAVVAEDMLPIGWQRIYRTLEAARQSLESIVSTQGPATSKFQIDRAAPSAELLAQVIDNRITGGIYDAVALCTLQIQDDFPAGRTAGDSIKVLSPLDQDYPDQMDSLVPRSKILEPPW